MLHCSCCCCHFCQPLPASISGILEQSSVAGAAAKGEAEAIYAPPELVFVLSLSLGECGTQLPVLNTKDTARTSLAHLSCTPYLHTSIPTHLSSLLFSFSFLHSIRVCGVKNLRIKFPYQPFYLQQFGNTFVWHSPPATLLSPSPTCTTLFPLSAWPGGDVSISA